jgi:mRNA interferase MazF
VIRRGDIWWADVDPVSGAQARRPVLIISADAFNRSRIPTVSALTISSDLRLVDAPGNVALPARDSALPTNSVINVAEIVTVAKHDLDAWIARVGADVMRRVEAGLRLALELGPPG